MKILLRSLYLIILDFYYNCKMGSPRQGYALLCLAFFFMAILTCNCQDNIETKPSADNNEEKHGQIKTEPSKVDADNKNDPTPAPTPNMKTESPTPQPDKVPPVQVQPIRVDPIPSAPQPPTPAVDSMEGAQSVTAPTTGGSNLKQSDKPQPSATPQEPSKPNLAGSQAIDAQKQPVEGAGSAQGAGQGAHDNVVAQGDSKIHGDLKVQGEVKVQGEAKVQGDVKTEGNDVKVQEQAKPQGEVQAHNTQEQIKIQGDAKVDIPSDPPKYTPGVAHGQHATNTGQHIPETPQPQPTPTHTPQQSHTLTLSEKQRQSQKLVVHSLASQLYKTPKKTILFQCSSQPQQFHLSPTVSSNLTISVLIYILQNNVYTLPADIQKSKPLLLYIYQNGNRIISQSQFYYETAVQIQAVAGREYVFRFYNQGVGKLVSFGYPSLVQQSQIKGVYGKDKGVRHLEDLQGLDRKVQEVTSRLRRNTLMDRVNNQIFLNSLTSYSGYQFVEMVFVLAITIFQVHTIKKMFSNDSIL